MKKAVSLLLVFVMVLTTFVAITIPASAASATGQTNYSSYNQPEKSGDYAYWNGSKVKKSGSTTTSEIKWMQAALNYCIKYEGLKTAYISVDGSFGPASKTATLAFQKAAGLSQDGSFGPSTIQKMINVLKDGKKTFSSDTGTSTSRYNITKTYYIGNTKYYMGTLKNNYNGVSKGTMVFLKSNYTAVTDSNTLRKLLFTWAVDLLSRKTSSFVDLTTSYRSVVQLNNVCQKIMSAQFKQKILGSASGSFASIMLSNNPKSLIASGEYLTKEGYIDLMTSLFLDRITTTAISQCNIINKHCADGISSFEEATTVKNALISARTAFLVAGTDCMLGLASGYTNMKSAVGNSLKTHFTAMFNTLVNAYGGTVVKVIDYCNTGESVLSELKKIYGYDKCFNESNAAFYNMIDAQIEDILPTLSKTQSKISK